MEHQKKMEHQEKMAHLEDPQYEVEEHREAREYARIAVWEMPLLSSKEASQNCAGDQELTSTARVC